MSNPTIEQLIASLKLHPHPEGGYYREVYRSPAQIIHPITGHPRAALTSIYFLLEAGDFSAWHRVLSEEVWLLLAGGPLELALLDQSGKPSLEILSTPTGAGEQPMAVVPANWLQAARPAEGSPWALCSCLVAPGFDFTDFSMPSKQNLLRDFPEQADFLLPFLR